jgi:hypothetical protein
MSGGGAEPPFEQLAFVYAPCGDVAAELEHLAATVGAEIVFAIEAFGARVAMVRLAGEPPELLLADHLEGERPVLVYRVADLERAVAELRARACDVGPRFEIPHGPCHEFRTPGGQRLAIYELTRPDVGARFAGRRDF